LERKLEDSVANDSVKQILFVSQSSIGLQLSKFAAELDEILPGTYSVVYKLHPNEDESWEDNYPWLAESDVNVIAEQEPSLYELFSESELQIGVFSTALFEGLAFGLKTLLCKYNHSSTLVFNDLLEKNAIQSVDTPSEVVQCIEEDVSTFDREAYFKSNAEENIVEELKNLAENGSVYHKQNVQSGG
jgi:hypothetical protein